MELDEVEGLRGAAVLDTLVRIETGNLHDAELITMIHDFKVAYMQALRETEQADDTAAAWAAWKGGDRELIHQPKLPLET